MRILHYLECIDFAQGGVITAALDICEALLGQGVEVDLLTGYEVDAPEAWRDGTAEGMRLTVDPAFITRYRPPEDLRAKVRPMLRDADLLHLHGVWNPLHRFLASEAVALGKPYVVTLHGMLDHWSMANGGLGKRLKKRAYLALHGRKILQQASAVHCTASMEATAAREYVADLQTVVLPYVVKFHGLLELDPGPLPADPARPCLLFLSRIHVKKRPDLMFDLAAAFPEVRVVLAGPVEADYERQLRARARELGVADRVEWAGMLRGADKRRAFAEADVFVLPTSQENFGIVLVEAMGARLPVVTTRGTAIWPELEAAGAWIVDQTPEALGAAVGEILRDPATAVARAQRGRDWAGQTLVAEALGPRFVELYRGLITPPQGSARGTTDDHHRGGGAVEVGGGDGGGGG